ncbi:phosphonate ABC transporter, permease protein PhnE [Staphylococcus felis]|uniref:phosphonate ABC transporter, permease protein PhnE n=1 Tax=Staphylococcus felis TaxID=46127 RepID=UPI000E252E2D|nr:phosphonate ABC transporter, permease protein PhnE [Staphylococcus felis]REI09117.1 phosphonate ABC transporter, permease protein PhnE [Staphylococcus felis]
MTEYKVQFKKDRVRFVIVTVVIMTLLVWAFISLPAFEIKSNAKDLVMAILSGLIHPDWGYVYMPEGEDLLRGLLETFAIAVISTFLSAVCCIPFAFLSAQNMIKWRTVSGVTKVFLSMIRVVPEIVIAILFIKAVGPGSFSGVLALGIHSVGMMGKLFAEDIEHLNLSATESLRASGANTIETWVFAVIPQIIPSFVSLVLYRFELNLRSASILGLIGAGGIGTPLIFALQTRDWDRVGIILIGLVLMVAIVDLISGKIREKLV